MKSSFARDFAFARLEARLPLLERICRSYFGRQFLCIRLVHDRAVDRKGADMFVILRDGSAIPVDVKTARRDPRYRQGGPCVPLELVSCYENDTPGYLLGGGRITRYVLFLFPHAPAVMLPFGALAAVFRTNHRDWSNRFGVSFQSTGRHAKGYHSSCIQVPIRTVSRAIDSHLRRFNRRLNSQHLLAAA